MNPVVTVFAPTPVARKEGRPNGWELRSGFGKAGLYKPKEFALINIMFLRAYTEVMSRLNSVKESKDTGATAVEYGLMVALIAAVIVTAVALLGTNLAALFNTVAGTIGGA